MLCDSLRHVVPLEHSIEINIKPMRCELVHHCSREHSLSGLVHGRKYDIQLGPLWVVWTNWRCQLIIHTVVHLMLHSSHLAHFVVILRQDYITLGP